MWIQVRSMDGRKSVRVDNLSKLTTIEELREKLSSDFDTAPDKQRLFYRGKQLEDGHSLFDYDVGLNDIIQLLVRHTAPMPSEDDKSSAEDSEDKMEEITEEETCTPVTTDKTEEAVVDSLYQVGEKVDARDLSMGAWFEAKVVKVTKEETPPTPDEATSSSSIPESHLYYHVVFDDYSEDEVVKLGSSDVRPRARYRMQWDQMSVDQTVMVNFNPDAPKQRGFWYDAIITRKEQEGRKIFCKLLLGNSGDAAQEVRVKFVDEIFRIESKSSPGKDGCGEEEEVEKRKKKPDCDRCKDDREKKCKFCACSVCGGKQDPDKQILCDECDMAFHLWCLDPPLTDVPNDEDWYCPQCKTDVSEVIRAGEKLRLSKKKASMVSKKQETNRDWGKGMACVGRTKVCTLVPSNHFGPIPGVPVGSLWKFRVQVSEAGVHRPHVAGIHGRENEGAYSIVLSGGYDDDKDDGEEFTYSGSGGRDLSGNKRTAKQSMDQKLTAMNKALARNCCAELNDKKGATASAWRDGKPVRVVRNHKGGKLSKYAPDEGNRYDGIYKVVKYWPAKNSTGFVVWKYLLRRDDPAPAPWTAEGKRQIKKLGLTMQYPDGFLEAQAGSSQSHSDEDDGGKKGKKRKADCTASVSPTAKQPRYDLTKSQKALIKEDSKNKKVWATLMESAQAAGLLNRIQEAFSCIVCQELVYHPVTTECSHNMCQACLQRSFAAEVYTCPNCRCTLGKDFALQVNKELQRILLDIFPGYGSGR